MFNLVSEWRETLTKVIGALHGNTAFLRINPLAFLLAKLVFFPERKIRFKFFIFHSAAVLNAK